MAHCFIHLPKILLCVKCLLFLRIFSSTSSLDSFAHYNLTCLSDLSVSYPSFKEINCASPHSPATLSLVVIILCFVCHLFHLTLMTTKYSQRYAWSEFHEFDWQLTGAHTLRKEKQKGPKNTFTLVFSSKLWSQLKIYTKVTYTKVCHSLEQSLILEMNPVTDILSIVWPQVNISELNMILTPCLRSHYQATHGYIKLTDCYFKRRARKNMMIGVNCC